MKKHWLLAALGIVALLGGIACVGAWMVISVRANSKYDILRAEASAHMHTAAPMTPAADALIAEVKSRWVKVFSEVNGPTSYSLKTVELSPSVPHVVELFTYRMPEYSYLPWSSRKNERAALKGLIQAIVLADCTGEPLYVSNNGDEAFIRCNEKVALLFSEDPSGLRETIYVREMKDSKAEAE
ncbi:MAG: hypothetical protein ACYC35_22655 [Pirellulales bacterium]